MNPCGYNHNMIPVCPKCGPTRRLLVPVRKCNGGQGIEPCPAHGLDNGFCDEVPR
jgi:hypothetical protein